MVRYLASFLIGAFLALGPGPVELLHQSEINRFWARHTTVIPARLPGNTGLARQAAQPVPADPATPLHHQPVQPVHDPATCAICMGLHAPMLAATTDLPATALEPHFESPLSTTVVQVCTVWISPVCCRGPPGV